MKFTLICIFSISYMSHLMAIREEYFGSVRPSVFENRERAWQGLKETEMRNVQEAARLRILRMQNSTQPQQSEKQNK